MTAQNEQNSGRIKAFSPRVAGVRASAGSVVGEEVEVRRSVAEQDNKAGAFPVVNPGLWENAGWLARLWWVPLVALAMAVRFYGLTASAIWGDEGSSLLLAEYSLEDLWFHAAHDVHPPLYFFMLRGWIEVFGDSIFSLRSMSAIPGVVAVGLGVWLTRLIATRRAAVLAGVLLGVVRTRGGSSPTPTPHPNPGVSIQYPFKPAEGVDDDADPKDPSAAAIDISYIVLPDGAEVMRASGFWREVASPPEM